MMNLKFIVIPYMLILGLFGCGDTPSSNTDPVPVISHSLKSFGFAAIDCAFDDPTDSEIKTNYADEVSGFTNIGQMCIFEPSESIGARLSTFKTSGIAAMLHIEALFFEHHADLTTGSGIKLTLRDDAEIRWSTFVKLNK